MSFWTQSTGEQATGEVADNDFKPVPKGWYKSIAESLEVKNSAQYGDKIKMKFRIAGPTHVNRVIFCNLDPWSSNDKKADRAKNVLVAFSTALGVPLLKGEPDDAWLAKLCNKPVEALFDVWEMEGNEGEMIEGNWLVNVRGGAKVANAKASPTPKIEDDDDIPF